MSSSPVPAGGSSRRISAATMAAIALMQIGSPTSMKAESAHDWASDRLAALTASYHPTLDVGSLPEAAV